MRLIDHHVAHVKLSIVALFVGMTLLTLSFYRGFAPSTAASASGPSPSFTGAPMEGNCTACHTTFEVNSGEGSVSIAGLPKNYLPGEQVPVTVTVSDPTGVLYGFQMTAVDINGAPAGTFVIPVPSPAPPAPSLQVISGFVNGQTRKYIEHTIQGITPTIAGSKSWEFIWSAPETRIGKVSFYAAGNAANSDGSNDNDQIYTNTRSSLSGSAIANFDGDGKSDFSVFRPSEGGWYSINSDQSGIQLVQFGQADDIPAPGDYDGDGITDRAVYRPSEGFWYLWLSSVGITGFPWGLEGDIPVPGDYDGDRKMDPAVFRPSDGKWYILKSTGGFSIVSWGLSADLPVPGDYDGDAKTDIAVFRPSEGNWYILRSKEGFAFTSFGSSGDIPVQGDYDGDGKHDVAIFRATTGEWWLQRSSLGIGSVQFGSSADIPSPADYDGDGRFDITIYRPSEGLWYSVGSGDLAIDIVNWGLPGDIPIPNTYLHK